MQLVCLQPISRNSILGNCRFLRCIRSGRSCTLPLAIPCAPSSLLPHLVIVCAVCTQLLQRNNSIQLLVGLRQNLIWRHSTIVRHDLLILEASWQISSNDVLVIHLKILVKNIFCIRFAGLNVSDILRRHAAIRHSSAHKLMRMPTDSKALYTECVIFTDRAIESPLATKNRLVALVAQPPDLWIHFFFPIVGVCILAGFTTFIAVLIPILLVSLSLRLCRLLRLLPTSPSLQHLRSRS
mmetsp:Transcript_137746/g.343795  ORF Transcript_137746/g.343795 Transcript_137746/m.343795 type:complete len:239 (+) Transcript_137746:100-816(+)